MTEGRVSGKHQHAPQQMRQELWLPFLGLAETRQYTLEQRHEAPLFSVGSENTTLARLYPFMRHSRGSQSSGSAVRWEFPLCRLSQVTWIIPRSGQPGTTAGPSRGHIWAVPCEARAERATVPTAHAPARTGPWHGCAARRAGTSSPCAEAPCWKAVNGPKRRWSGCGRGSGGGGDAGTAALCGVGIQTVPRLQHGAAQRGPSAWLSTCGVIGTISGIPRRRIRAAASSCSGG